MRQAVRAAVGAMAVMVAWLTSGGCVEREMLIRSEPAGAAIYMDGELVGETPMGMPFVHYGTREVKLKKEGYKTLIRQEKIRAPWYQYMPIDFFAEVLWPATIRDEHTLLYTLEAGTPQADPDKLLERARATKAESEHF